MAKGYAGYISQEWIKIEKELLQDAYMKRNCNVYPEDEGLFEDVTFQDNHKTDLLTEEPKHEIALYPLERYLHL